ncbi:hypothetical protein BD410DRAFT_903178, partial [Rickenella mellea]
MVFAPKMRGIPGRPKKMDWSLTYLAIALFGYMLSTGIFQLKYLYAEHVYGWDAQQLSYYISLAGGLRAVHLLFLLPLIIATFKPKPKTSPPSQLPPSTSTLSQSNVTTQPPPKKPAPTPTHLASEIRFDLLLTRFSFLTDILSQSLVSLSSTRPSGAAQAVFVVCSVISSFGSGV